MSASSAAAYAEGMRRTLDMIVKAKSFGRVLSRVRALDSMIAKLRIWGKKITSDAVSAYSSSWWRAAPGVAPCPSCPARRT